jgi:hypothetical protein
MCTQLTTKRTGHLEGASHGESLDTDFIGEGYEY